jgi:hypothetical protein
MVPFDISLSQISPWGAKNISEIHANLPPPYHFIKLLINSQTLATLGQSNLDKFSMTLKRVLKRLTLRLLLKTKNSKFKYLASL